MEKLSKLINDNIIVAVLLLFLAVWITVGFTKPEQKQPEITTRHYSCSTGGISEMHYQMDVTIKGAFANGWRLKHVISTGLASTGWGQYDVTLVFEK